jgi:hypothetical protein
VVHLFPEVPRTRVEETIAELLQVPDRDLPLILQDYGDELTFQLVMHPGLLQSLTQSLRGGRAAGTARLRVKRQLSRSAFSSRLRRQVRRR